MTDLTGQQFGRWSVIRFDRSVPAAKGPKHYWIVRCSCPDQVEKSVRQDILTGGKSQSCGCLKKEMAAGLAANLWESKRDDPLGDKYGSLTVIKFHEARGGHTFYWCQCDCDENAPLISLMLSHLKSGHTSSCGHLREQIGRENLKGAQLRNLKHGMTGSRTYASWQSMIQRCTNPNDTGYEYYGWRGIKVCDRWLNSFEDFLQDVGERPEGMTLDRIDPEKNYEPGNVKWSTHLEQMNNRRNSRNKL